MKNADDAKLQLYRFRRPTQALEFIDSSIDGAKLQRHPEPKFDWGGAFSRDIAGPGPL